MTGGRPGTNRSNDMYTTQQGIYSGQYSATGNCEWIKTWNLYEEIFHAECSRGIAMAQEKF